LTESQTSPRPACADRVEILHVPEELRDPPGIGNAEFRRDVPRTSNDAVAFCLQLSGDICVNNGEIPLELAATREERRKPPLSSAPAGPGETQALMETSYC
jgi:hypothetical protein